MSVLASSSKIFARHIVSILGRYCLRIIAPVHAVAQYGVALSYKVYKHVGASLPPIFSRSGFLTRHHALFKFRSKREVRRPANSKRRALPIGQLRLMSIAATSAKYLLMEQFSVSSAVQAMYNKRQTISRPLAATSA